MSSLDSIIFSKFFIRAFLHKTSLRSSGGSASGTVVISSMLSASVVRALKRGVERPHECGVLLSVQSSVRDREAVVRCSG